MQTPRLLTEIQVSRRYQIPAGTLRNYRYLGDGPPFLRLGRAIRYRIEDLEAWLKAHRVEPGEAA